MSSNDRFRYPGTRPFETDEADLFFGRSADSEQLCQQVLNEKTVLLYAKSGLGKSSLINAGLLPLLTKTSCYKILQVRFGNYNAQLKQYDKPLDVLIAQVKQRINPDARYLDKIIPDENSLWYRFKQRQHPDGEQDLLFIFDQFEELLTYPEEDIFYFKKQFAHLLFSAIPANIRNVLDRKLAKAPDLLTKEELRLLYTPLRTKALFAIRSDRMSDLNRISDYFPNILKAFYELKPLNRQQAKEAIEEPANKQGAYSSPVFSFAPDLVKTILADLEDRETHTVESFQLQLVCRYAEELIVQEKTKAKNLVAEEDLGDIESIFAENYRRVLADLPTGHQYNVQVLIEEKLIVAGNRVPLPELVIVQHEGIPQEVIDKLLNSHLLRAERNSVGGRSIELSHDTLVVPVTEAYEKRKAAEKLHLEEERVRLENERIRAETVRKQQELEAAKQEADLQRRLAEGEAKLRKDAVKARRKARRNLRFVIAIAGLAVVVALLAFKFYIQAENATKKFEKIARIASVARDSAEMAFKRADSAYEQIKQDQAISKARELKKSGEYYEDLSEFNAAIENYKNAFKEIEAYPELPMYKELQKKLRNQQ